MTLIWPTSLVVFAAAVVAHLRRHRPGRELAPYVALFVAALALRLSAPSQPHDVQITIANGLTSAAHGGWFDVPSWREGRDGLYSPAHHLLVPWMGVFGRDVDLILHAVHAVAGALTCAWVAAWASHVVPRPVALATGVLLTVAGPHVRFSHTDAPQILEMALTHGAVWWTFTTAGSQRPVHRVAPALALALATGMRPESPVALITYGLVVFVLRAGHMPSRRDGAWTLALASILAAPRLVQLALHVATNGAADAVGGGLDSAMVTYFPRSLTVFDPFYTPWVVPLGMLFAPFHRPWRTTQTLVALALAIVLSLVTLRWSPHDGVMLTVVRHQLRGLPFFLLLSALGWGVAVDRLPAGRARQVAVVALAVAVAPFVRLTWLPTSLEAEYAFVRRTLPRVAAEHPGCRVSSPYVHQDGGLKPPTHLVEVLGLDLTWDTPDGTRALDLPSHPCTLAYVGAECADLRRLEATGCPDGSPACTTQVLCEAYYDGFTLEPIATETLPSRGWLDVAPPEGGPVVGFHRLRPTPPDTGAPPPRGP